MKKTAWFHVREKTTGKIFHARREVGTGYTFNDPSTGAPLKSAVAVPSDITTIVRPGRFDRLTKTYYETSEVGRWYTAVRVDTQPQWVTDPSLLARLEAAVNNPNQLDAYSSMPG